MEPQETKLVTLRVPVNSTITRVKAKKEDESQSQEIEFEIQADLQNPTEVVRVVPGVSQALMECWEWDLETGDPIFQDPNQPWKWYVPHSFIEKSNSATERRVFKNFMTGMRENVQEFDVRIGNGATSDWSHQERKFYSEIHGYDLKKLEFERAVGFKMVTIKVKKTDEPLLPYSSLPSGEPPLVALPKLIKPALDQLNSNAKYGHYGPAPFGAEMQGALGKT